MKKIDPNKRIGRAWLLHEFYIGLDNILARSEKDPKAKHLGYLSPLKDEIKLMIFNGLKEAFREDGELMKLIEGDNNNIYYGIFDHELTQDTDSNWMIMRMFMRLNTLLEHDYGKDDDVLNIMRNAECVVESYVLESQNADDRDSIHDFAERVLRSNERIADEAISGAKENYEDSRHERDKTDDTTDDKFWKYGFLALSVTLGIIGGYKAYEWARDDSYVTANYGIDGWSGDW